MRALEFGGVDGVPNPSLVESAISRPYNGYYRKIEEKAAALVESVAKNHGFADGNKRTALILLHILLERSDYCLSPSPGESIEDAAEQMVLAVVMRHFNHSDLVAWFKRRIRRTAG